MQEQWEEVQSFIRRKNKRITELTEQLNGADIDVGFLLASHKERIEAACLSERKYFRIAERVEDMELELKKKNKLRESLNCLFNQFYAFSGRKTMCQLYSDSS
jgi:hypothetical protein